MLHTQVPDLAYSYLSELNIGEDKLLTGVVWQEEDRYSGGKVGICSQTWERVMWGGKGRFRKRIFMAAFLPAERGVV